MAAHGDAGTATAHCRGAFWIFVAFSLFYVAMTRGHFVGTDEIGVYQPTRSLWEQHDLSTGPINNTFPGRNGKYYSVYNVGQSIAALPLYGLGKAVGGAFTAAQRPDWIQTFAGRQIGCEPSQWGGSIEIFFVNLFNCLVTALLCAVFFAFSVRLGASLRSALAATVLLGLTSFAAPFSTGFLQHSSEALFLLWAFYGLYVNTRWPNWRARVGAGCAVALMVFFRFPAAVALPGLGLYLLGTVWLECAHGESLRKNAATLASWLLSFGAPVLAGTLLHFGVIYYKFETLNPLGRYDQRHFGTPLFTGLFGNLLSPGDSIFLFTPLLVLVPWTFRDLGRRDRPLAGALLVVSVSYLLLYSTIDLWHGLWSSLGPRYLVPVVPLLLLPLAPWLQRVGTRAWFAVAPLGLLGLWAQLVHVAVNFFYVSAWEGYGTFQPPEGFLFIPQSSPLLAHWRALLAADSRVDMWLINVYREFGAGRLLTIAGPLLVLLVVSVWRLWRSLSEAEASHLPPDSVRFACRRWRVVACLAVVWGGTAVTMTTHRVHQPERAATKATSPGAAMAAGMDALYARQQPCDALAFFRKVLETNPNHYGANYQTARALDRAGNGAAARPVWEKVLKMAEASNDKQTANYARSRLSGR